MRDQPIERVMSTPPVVGPGSLVSAARARAAARGIHHLPVVADGRLIGILGAAERRHVGNDDPEHIAAALLYLAAKARHLEAVLRAAKRHHGRRE